MIFPLKPPFMDDFLLLFHLLFFETNMAIKAPKSEKRATLSQWKTSGPQKSSTKFSCRRFLPKKKRETPSPKPDQFSQEMHQEMPVFWRMFLRKTMEATMTHLPADGFPLLVAVEGEAAVVRELHFQGQAFLPCFGEAWMKGPQMLGTRPFHKDYMTLPNVIGQILISLDWICLFLDQLGWGSVYEPSNSHGFCYLRSSPTSPTSICPVLQLVTQRNGDGITFRRLAAVHRAGVLPWDLAQDPRHPRQLGPCGHASAGPLCPR